MSFTTLLSAIAAVAAIAAARIVPHIVLIYAAFLSSSIESLENVCFLSSITVELI
jgi:hypothetical protein